MLTGVKSGGMSAQCKYADGSRLGAPTPLHLPGTSTQGRPAMYNIHLLSQLLHPSYVVLKISENKHVKAQQQQ